MTLMEGDGSMCHYDGNSASISEDEELPRRNVDYTPLDYMWTTNDTAGRQPGGYNYSADPVPAYLRWGTRQAQLLGGRLSAQGRGVLEAACTLHQGYVSWVMIFLPPPTPPRGGVLGSLPWEWVLDPHLWMISRPLIYFPMEIMEASVVVPALQLRHH